MIWMEDRKVQYCVVLPATLIKAKYTRRWKGKDGKWQYEYAKTKKPTSKNTGSTKYIWSKTRKEFMDKMIKINPIGLHQASIASGFHFLAVSDAVKSGKTVPANVLKDYPKLIAEMKAKKLKRQTKEAV